MEKRIISEIKTEIKDFELEKKEINNNKIKSPSRQGIKKTSQQKNIIKTDFSMNTEIKSQEKDAELSLRPALLEDYIGQQNIKKELSVYIAAAKKRNTPLSHCLFYGPPGLGKTTIAGIIANEMGAKLKITSAPAIEKTGDLASLLMSLPENGILFIDEIHRLDKTIEEFLYSAMEDNFINITIGKDKETKSISIDLPKFTLIGATTRVGMLSAPLRDRFGNIFKLEYYSEEELSQIIKRTSVVLDCDIDDESAINLAKRSRGTPRLANRLFKKIRDFIDIEHNGNFIKENTEQVLDFLQIDSLGLDKTDKTLLNILINDFEGKPVGLETLSAILSEDQDTIKDVNEAFLIANGFIQKTPKGRIATKKAIEHMGFAPAQSDI